MQGLLDEVEFLQNHLGLLDLNEVSEELPNRGAEIRQHSPDGLHRTADSLKQAAAFSCSQVSTSQHLCWRLYRMPWNRRTALARCSCPDSGPPDRQRLRVSGFCGVLPAVLPEARDWTPAGIPARIGAFQGPARGEEGPFLPDLTEASQTLGEMGLRSPAQANPNCLPSAQQLHRKEDFSQTLGLAPRFPRRRNPGACTCL